MYNCASSCVTVIISFLRGCVLPFGILGRLHSEADVGASAATGQHAVRWLNMVDRWIDNSIG